MRIKLQWLAAALAVAAMPAAGDPPAGPLRIAGSTTLFPVAEAWVEGFRDRYPDSPVELESGGTTAGLAALLDGGADLALASRPLRDAEETRARQLGLQLERIEVARDALAVVVHRGNPVTALTAGQLLGLFSGELSSWDAVGGPAQSVQVVTRNPDSHTGQFFRQQILGDRSFAATAEVVSTRAEMIARVAAEPWALGFAGLADAINSRDREQVQLVRLVLDDADPAALGDEDPEPGAYAVSRPLFFFARAPRTAPVEEFVSFVLGAEGQALIVASNFFPLNSSAAD